MCVCIICAFNVEWGNSIICLTTLSFFYRQPVFNQLALEWPIAKQFSGLKPYLLSKKKTTDERKMEFSFVISVK